MTIFLMSARVSFYHPLTETVQLEIVCGGHDSSCYSQEILFIEMNILSFRLKTRSKSEIIRLNKEIDR